jgi:hypothetical protein
MSETFDFKNLSEELEISYIEKIMDTTSKARNIMKNVKPIDYPDWLKKDLMDDSKIDDHI